jgi:O-Antigen ligase
MGRELLSSFGKLCAVLAVASMVFGGSSFSGKLGDTVLQMASIGLLAAAFLRANVRDAADRKPFAVMPSVLLLLLISIPIFQLIPLPPTVWPTFPAGRAIKEALDASAVETTWRPLSVAPYATWLSALSLLPPIALFWGTLSLSYRDRRMLSLVVLAAGVASALLGLMQLAQGPQSALRFYEITNPSDAVGFFANRNHLAALLYSVLLFAFVWTAAAVAALQETTNKRDARPPAAVVGAFAVLVILISAQVMARSRAGMVLSMIAIGSGVLLAVPFRSALPSRMTAGRLIAGACALAVVFLAQFGLYRAFERFEADPLADARIVFGRNTLDAAQAFFPTGSGLGSFVRVYGLFEKPQDAIANTYANHAHNDILELYLETGLAGLTVAAIVGFWFCIRLLRVWISRPQGASLVDSALARAASLCVVLLSAHSVVDYPLRTTAMMAILAFSFGLLVEPRRPVNAGRASNDERTEHAQEHDWDGQSNGQFEAQSLSPLAQSPLSQSPQSWAPTWPQGPGQAENKFEERRSSAKVAIDGGRPGEKWGPDIQWPNAWQKPVKDPSKKN